MVGIGASMGASALRPSVLMDRLVCGYDGKVVVEATSLEVAHGEILVIAGRSGCGKTTVLRTIAGLLAPISGRVEVLGLDLWAADLPARRPVLRRLGVLFQGGALLGSMSVGDNLLMPVEEHVGRISPEVASRLVDAKLSAVGLTGTAHLFPSELSGGMRKRVALARALMLDPDLLLFDEPTSGLDPVVAAGIDELVLALRERLGMAMVVISHDLASIERIADRVLLLDDGRPVALGPVQALASSGDPVVRGFFHRSAPAGGLAGASIADRVGRGAGQ